MNSLKDRSDVTTFLIGDDLGVLRFQLVQIKGQTLTLKSLLSKTKDDDNKVQINSLIKVSEEEQNKVGDFLLSQENKFSLFGWFVHII